MKGPGRAPWTHFGLGLAHLGLGHVMPIGPILASDLIGSMWDQFSPRTNMVQDHGILKHFSREHPDQNHEAEIK